MAQDHKLRQKLISPKNVWIWRKENGFWLVANPAKKIIRKIDKIIPDFGVNPKIIKNKIISNSLTTPIKIYLDITQRCNLKCLHCLSSSGEFNMDLPFKTIKEIFKWAEKRGVFQVKLGGGEPILHPDFWKIVNLANNSFLQVSLSTNGCLINSEMAKRLKTLGVKVSVSLDGNKLNHDKLRGKGIFEKAVKCVKLLTSLKMNIAIRTTIMNGKIFNNLDDVPFLVRFSKKYDIPVKIRRALPSGRASSNSLALIHSDKNYWKTMDWLNKQKDKGIKVDLWDSMDFNEDCSSKVFIGKFDCGAGTRGLHISSFGVVSPCVFLGKKFNAGKISTSNDLDRIWRHSRKFSTLRNITLKPNNDCRNCKRNTKCGGECRAAALIATGRLNGKDPCCPMNRNKYLSGG